MRDLSAPGIVDLQDGQGNSPDSVSLSAKWNWLLPAESEMEVCEAVLSER